MIFKFIFNKEKINFYYIYVKNRKNKRYSEYIEFEFLNFVLFYWFYLKFNVSISEIVTHLSAPQYPALACIHFANTVITSQDEYVCALQ